MSFKVNRLFGFAIGILSLAIALSVVFLAVPATEAAANGCNNGPFPQFGRACEHGYFTNTPFNSGLDLWSGGLPSSLGCLTGGRWCPGSGSNIDKINGYINFIEAEKTSGNPQLVTSAEFIIDTQEGFAPGTRGAAWNPAVLADWEARLRNGVTDGTLKVQWNNAWPWGCNQLDTMYGPGPNDIDAYYTFRGGEVPDCNVTPTVPAINFIDVASGKVVYQIKRTCGNPFGKIGKLPDVPFHLVPGGFLTTNFIPAGTTDTLHVTLASTGPNESYPADFYVDKPGNIDNPVGNPGAGQTKLIGGPGSTVYDSGYGVRGGPTWYWNTTPIPVGRTPAAQFNFTVSLAAPPGTITFNVCVKPASLANDVKCFPVVLTVVSERQPVVVGKNGDVHAGGGICGGPLDFNAKVEGWPGLPGGVGNRTEYVVSATALGGVSSFDSNSGNGSGLTETLGSTGGYRPTPFGSVPPYPAVDEVCREDLLGYAIKYKTSGGGGILPITPAMATNLDVGTLTGAPVYWYNSGGILHLHGQVNSAVTIVAESGTVRIDNNITLSPGSHSLATLPSLGIIAASDINISGSVTQADAYMFSNGTIDTCYQGVGNVSGCVGPSLTVNGFLMANNLWFHREGAFNVDGNPVTETIALNPQIYINPPKFFDASVDSVGLQGQGEKPPLY